MAGTIMPAPWFTGLDDNGVSVIGGKLYTYAAGTSTPLATYSDVDLAVPNTNPVILDGGGRATVYLAPVSYKFVLKDEHDVTIRTQDHIAATISIQGQTEINGDLVFTGDYYVRRNTLDGADTGSIGIHAGGDASGGGTAGQTRGAVLNLFGNEHPTFPGAVGLSAGFTPGSKIILNGGGSDSFYFHPSGGLSLGPTEVDGGLPSLIIGGLPAAGTTHTYLDINGLFQSGVAGSGAATHFRFTNANGIIGSISSSGTTTAYNTTCDATLKDDLALVQHTDVLARLRVHLFRWKTDGALGTGVFAQEVAEVLPAAVTVGDGHPWQVDYSKFVPELIIGWQQHEARLLAVLERLERVESRRDGD